MIKDMVNIDINRMRIIYKGRELIGNKTINEYF